MNDPTNLTLEEARQMMEKAREGLSAAPPIPEDAPFEISFSTAKRSMMVRFKNPDDIFKLAQALEKLLDQLGIPYEEIWKSSGDPL